MSRRPTAQDLHREALRRSTSGKRDQAPCGHEGEYVLPGFIRCLSGCDGEAVPEYVEPEKTECIHLNAGYFSHPWGGQVLICLDCRMHCVGGVWREP